ncbi:MAG TPA: hypothetical protein PK788_04675 [Gemmatimonadaceae bacterium]|nr:hypothetical protein [Gemmatimonadaceae bacterium]HRQ77231.1 hypothetical protein [Gemmatimonadaceae bacterium]
MRPSVAIAVLTAGAVAVLAAYGLGFIESFATLTPTASATARATAPWLLAIGATLVLTGLGLLGAGPRAPRLASAVLVACSCTMLGFAYALTLAPHVVAGPLLLGLPRATTLMLILTGGIPLVLLPLAYAWAFPREVDGGHGA